MEEARRRVYSRGLASGRVSRPRTAWTAPVNSAGTRTGRVLLPTQRRPLTGGDLVGNRRQVLQLALDVLERRLPRVLVAGP
jgi:hypothetical protein